MGVEGSRIARIALQTWQVPPSALVLGTNAQADPVGLGTV